jgi:predicted RNA-binding Zn-ribbon protein involved in translation (DUF1610 family)
MEKLGVDVDPDATKTASEKAHPACPSCDRPLLKNVNVPTCPACGTKPFEPKA